MKLLMEFTMFCITVHSNLKVAVMIVENFVLRHIELGTTRRLLESIKSEETKKSHFLNKRSAMPKMLNFHSFEK